jgi:muramidase (phage lysozyme)
MVSIPICQRRITMANDDYPDSWRVEEGLFPNQRPKPLLQSWWGGTLAARSQGDVSALGIDAASQDGAVEDARSLGAGGGFYTGLTPYQPGTPLEPFRRLKAAQESLYDPRVSAMLATIRAREGREYNVITGGQTIDDFSQHPNIRVKDSTAAGAYQFNHPTWMEHKAAVGLSDFSPASQDLAAADLFIKLKATDKLSSGDIDGAIRGRSTLASISYHCRDND